MSYIQHQIKQMLQDNLTSDYPLKLKIQGEGGETKWMNISRDDIAKISDIFKK